MFRIARQKIAKLILPEMKNPENPMQETPSQPKPSRKSPQLSQAEQKKLLDAVKAKVDAVDNTAADREDVISLAYYRGKQWVCWDTGKSQVFEAPNPKKKSRYTANRLIKIVRTEHAKIFKNRVIMSVNPASSEDEDLGAAKVGDKVAAWVEYDKKLQTKDSRLVLWGLTTRIAFMHPYWNPALGQLANPETGEHEGDVDFDVLSCFEVKFDRAATCWDDVAWACKIKVRTVDYIKRVYGVDVKPESGITRNNLYDVKMSFLPMESEIRYQPLENVARVFEYWEKPTVEYPWGQRITYAGDKILYVLDDIGFGAEDDTERELPFYPYVHIDLPGSVSGTNNVEQCRPQQKEYNRTRSQIIDSKDLTSYPKLARERGSVDDEIDNEIGGIVEYNSGGTPPKYINPPQIGADAYQNCQQILEEMNFISGQNQVAQAPNDASGYLMELLIEEDDTVLAPSIENYISCKQAYMSYVLKMIRFRYIAPRTLRVVGKDSLPDLMEFTGTDLTSWDVRVERGSLMATSRVARRAEIMNLVNMGVLDRVRDRDKILQMFEFGMIDDLYNEVEQDTRQAKKEQANWEAGQIETNPGKAVREFFNHAVHIAEHNRWRKTDKYEALDPVRQNLIDMHVMAHEMLLAQQQPPIMIPPDGKQQSAGTPYNFGNLQSRLGNGEQIGNSMQGMEQGGGPNAVA